MDVELEVIALQGRQKIERLAIIDATMDSFLKERKELVLTLNDLKQREFELLRSSTPIHTFPDFGTRTAAASQVFFVLRFSSSFRV